MERLGILDKWGQEQTRIVWRRVETWAADNSVTPRVAWQERGQTGESAHHTLLSVEGHRTVCTAYPRGGGRNSDFGCRTGSISQTALEEARKALVADP